MSSKALAPRDRVMDLALAGPVANIRELANRMTEMSEHANVIGATIALPMIPAKQAVALAVVAINAETNQWGQGPEVYFDRRFCDKESDEVALGKVAILKLLAAAGVSPVENRRLDDASDPFYCNWHVVLAGRDLTGVWRTQSGSKEIDLRDGSPLLTKPEKIGEGRDSKKTGRLVLMDESAIGDMRKNIQANAETKALLRAARAFLNLRSKYKRADVEKPWVVPRLVPNLDPNDPADAAALREEALGRTRQLYGADPGAGARHAPPPVGTTKPDIDPGEIIPGEVVSGGVGTGSPAGIEPPVRSAGSTPAPSTKPADDDWLHDADSVADLTHEEPVKSVPIICLCPCGDQTEVTKEVAEKTLAAVGAVRCRDCFPAGKFNFDKHRDVRDFKLPKKPGITLDDIRRNVAGAKK